MADVARSRVSRGQIILVTGLLIAVTLLVLVLLLNAVIYTENIATRGIEGDSDNAYDFQEVMESEFERLLAVENQLQRDNPDRSDDFGEYEERIERATDHFVNNTSERWLHRGKLVGVEYTLSESIGIWEMDIPDTETEPMVANVDRAWNFTIEPDHEDGDLWEADNESLENVPNDSIHGYAGGFVAGDWELRIFDVNGNMSITDGTNESICEDPEEIDPTDEIKLDLVNETVKWNGGSKDCVGALWGDEGTPQDVDAPYTIELVNEDNISGGFTFVGAGDDIDTTAQEHSPLAHGGEVRVTFRSSEVEYEANTTVAGELP